MQPRESESEGESEGTDVQEAVDEEARQVVESVVESKETGDVEVQIVTSIPLESQPVINPTEAATPTTNVHQLPYGVEKDAGSQPVHLHAQTSHSTVSQQTIVSLSHGDIAHIPSTSRSEMVGVVIRETLPHLSPSFIAHRVLDPLDATSTMSSFTRTLFSASTALSFGSSAGTDVVLISKIWFEDRLEVLSLLTLCQR